MNKTVVYIARINRNLFPGVEKKIIQTVNVLENNGYATELYLIDSDIGKISIIHFLKAIWKSSSKKIIIRNDFFLFLAFFILIYRRLQGCRITIDIPTPIITALKEIKDVRSINKYIKIILFHIIYPYSLYPATKVLQYAEESGYFSFGIKSKIKLIANGIDVNSIPLCQSSNKKNEELIFIGVATLANWHGFDRLIRGIYQYINANMKNRSAIKFIIVGDGPARQEWELLVKQLNLDQVVKFMGYKAGIELDQLFDQADVAVASLGLYRKNLKMASDLKKREYAARGLPFIACGADIDFSPNPDFVKLIPNDNSVVNIADIILWHAGLGSQGQPVQIREYAKQKLDFSVKIAEML
ncbi:MAG: glycosyltransferase [Desulfomicrobium sp.]|nr:glycosyltransferase [Desulfomicrobium sp.]